MAHEVEALLGHREVADRSGDVGAKADGVPLGQAVRELLGVTGAGVHLGPKPCQFLHHRMPVVQYNKYIIAIEIELIGFDLI
jgi:hypothetical protein